jgi:hypothetical protein
MEVEAEDLRMLLTSRNSQLYGQALLNAVRQGDVVIIHNDDGTTVTLTEVHMAKRLLCDLFQWKCP